jgi:hypothetical protein
MPPMDGAAAGIENAHRFSRNIASREFLPLLADVYGPHARSGGVV